MGSLKKPEELYELWLSLGKKEYLKAAVYYDWLRTASPLQNLADKYKLSLVTVSKIISNGLKKNKKVKA